MATVLFIIWAVGALSILPIAGRIVNENLSGFQATLGTLVVTALWPFALVFGGAIEWKQALTK